jgi:5'-nucleotidase/UDP-sugar diphosphatase
MTFRLRVLAIGDVYSEMPVRGRGGYAELAHVIGRLRREWSGRDEHVLLVGLGDMLGGSNLCEITQGEHVVKLMNALHFDACAVGNHEFDHTAAGEQVFARRVAESQFDWLACNVSVAGEPIAGVLPHTVRSFAQADGSVVRVGLLGICTVQTPSLSYPSAAVHFESHVDAARRSVAVLRDTHRCDLVIALTHMTFYEDKQLVKQVRGIDLVLGGHDHDAVSAMLSEPSRVGDTLVFKPGMNAYWCGVIDLQLLLGRASPDEQTGFVTYRNEAVALVDKSLPCAEADACTAIIEHYEAQRRVAEAEAARTILVPALPAPLNVLTKVVRSREASCGSLLADSMRAWSPSDIGMINGGFMRNDKLYPAGAQLTQADVLEMLPFGRPCVLMSIAGADLQLGVEQMLAAAPAATGAFPHFSRGVELRYKPLAPALAKIVSFKLNGEPIAADRLYRVSTSNFLLGGGDGITAFKKGEKLESREVRISKVLCHYLAQHGDNAPIPGDADGRIVAID